MRVQAIEVAKDTYNNDIVVGSRIVFSWAGDLTIGSVRMITEHMRGYRRVAMLHVNALSRDGKFYGRIIKVKDSTTTVKIND